MRKRWYYLYVILYPSLGYKFYYGSRITDRAPEEDQQYFGSPVTFATYNDPTHADFQADAIKVILRADYRRESKKAATELSKAETQPGGSCSRPRSANWPTSARTTTARGLLAWTQRHGKNGPASAARNQRR
jgi:hypothetical protein